MLSCCPLRACGLFKVSSFYPFGLVSDFTFAGTLLRPRGFRWTLFWLAHGRNGLIILASEIWIFFLRTFSLTTPLPDLSATQRWPDFYEEVPHCQISHYTCIDRTKRTKFGAVSPMRTVPVHNLVPFEELNHPPSIALMRLSFFKLLVTLIVPCSV